MRVHVEVGTTSTFIEAVRSSIEAAARIEGMLNVNGPGGTGSSSPNAGAPAISYPAGARSSH